MIAAALAASLALGVGPATADDIDDRRAAAEARQRAILKNQEKLRAELEDTDAALSQAVLDLQTIEARLPVAQAELDAAEAQLERSEREAALLAQRLSDARTEEEQITAEVAKGAEDTSAAKATIAQMARMAYRGEGEVSSLGIVTGAQSTQEFIDGYAASSTAARSQARTLEELQAAEAKSRNREARLTAVRELVSELKAQADQNVLDAKAAKKAAVDRKAEIEALAAQQRQKQATIAERKSIAVAEIERGAADQKALESELKAVIAEQAERDRKAAEERRKRAAAQGGSGSGGPGDPGPGKGSSGSSNRLTYPTAVPHITSNYGMRFHPIAKVWRLHAGTDFRAYCGTPILSAAPGTVVYARTVANGAKQVVVNHGSSGGANVMTGYLHLSKFAVSPGQRVARGQVIGYSGNTGVSAGCHLHFEVYVNGNTVNPMSRL